MEPVMTKPIARDPIYRRRRFEAEIIELCVRWYITYRLGYRAPRRHDGRARIDRVSHHDPAVSDPVRTGVRKMVGPMGARRALILAG
jgi:hypothetical protein